MVTTQSPGSNNAGPAAAAAAFASPEAVSQPTIYLLAANAAWPIAMRALYMVMPRGFGSRSLFAITNSIDSLLTLAAVVLFLIWTYRIVNAINLAGQGPTTYGPGMAVGCWFIPFANFGMPFASMSDVWRRTMQGDDRGWVVPLWWFTYLGLILFRIFFSFLRAGALHSLGSAVMGLGWLSTAVHVTTFACWALMVHWITERTMSAPIRRA